MNPGRWGKALALHLRVCLDGHGFTGGPPYAEDWGWAVPIHNEDFPLWIGCGNHEEYEDGFLCFIEPSSPTVRKLYRKTDTTARVEAIASVLDGCLRAHPNIRGLRWWTDDEVGR